MNFINIFYKDTQFHFKVADIQLLFYDNLLFAIFVENIIYCIV